MKKVHVATVLLILKQQITAVLAATMTGEYLTLLEVIQGCHFLKVEIMVEVNIL